MPFLRERNASSNISILNRPVPFNRKAHGARQTGPPRLPDFFAPFLRASSVLTNPSAPDNQPFVQEGLGVPKGRDICPSGERACQLLCDSRAWASRGRRRWKSQGALAPGKARLRGRRGKRPSRRHEMGETNFSANHFTQTPQLAGDTEILNRGCTWINPARLAPAGAATKAG